MFGETFTYGTREWYEQKVLCFCSERGIKPEQLTSAPVRPLTKNEKEVIVKVYNNPNTVSTLQAVLDNIQRLMGLVAQGISPENIYLMANPYSDKACVGYIDPTILRGGK